MAPKDKSRESSKRLSYEDAVGVGDLIQMIMGVQSSIGELGGKVDGLSRRLDDLSTQINQVKTDASDERDKTDKRLRVFERILYTAAGVIVAFGVLAWMLRPFLTVIAEKAFS